MTPSTRTEPRRPVRVVLPVHLRNLAGVGREVSIDVPGAVTTASVLSRLEDEYPMLRGTIREHDTLRRRAFLRYFACEQDLSHEPDDALLPDAVASGTEPLMIVGAMAGG
jgi:sulfur-carrier protein